MRYKDQILQRLDAATNMIENTKRGVESRSMNETDVTNALESALRMLESVNELVTLETE